MFKKRVASKCVLVISPPLEGNGRVIVQTERIHGFFNADN